MIMKTTKGKKQDDVTKSVDDQAKKKKKKRKPKSVTKENNGPPSNVDDFSSNWKKFLNAQPKPEQKKNNNEINANGTGEKNETNSINNPKHLENKAATKNSDHKAHKKRKRNESANEIPSQTNDIWFDVDPELLKKTKRQNVNNDIKFDKDETTSDHTNHDGEEPVGDKENDGKLTRYLAIDCEMVGVGIEGKESVLARVSIVNSRCECVYDKFVKSAEKVVDYRTHVSGVRASDLQHGSDYATVQKEVSEMLKGRVVVGHAVQNDFKVLMLSHPAKDTRDTSKYKPFRTLLKTKRPALKRLVDEILHQKIQKGEHSSVVDAQMTMKLYKKFKKEWEKSMHCKNASTALIEPKEVFMGTSTDVKKKRKVNKWKKIRDRKKKKQRED